MPRTTRRIPAQDLRLPAAPRTLHLDVTRGAKEMASTWHFGKARPGQNGEVLVALGQTKHVR